MQPLIVELIEKLKLLPDHRQGMEALKQMYLTNPKLRPEIERAVLQLAYRHRDQFLLEPPSQPTARGNYPIGQVYCGRELYSFGLRRPELLQHAGIYGMTGAGKTEALDVLLSQVLKNGKPVMVFDWDGSHRHLLSRPEGEKLLYFTPGSMLCPFPFNPHTVPESFSYNQRLSYLGGLYHSLAERHFQNETLNKEGVKLLLTRLAEQLIQSGKLNFTFQELYELAEDADLVWREKEWRTTLLNFLRRFTRGPLGTVFNVKNGIPIAALLARQTLFDLKSLINPVEKADFVETLLSHLYECHLRQREPIGQNELKILFVIEEIHNIFTYRRRKAIINSFFREMRKWGGGLVVTDQHPSLVSVQVRGNTYTTIAQNVESPEDRNILVPALLLRRTHLPYLGSEWAYLSRIPAASGLYIVKLQGRYTKPFLVKIAALPKIGKEMTDEELRRKMSPYYRHLGIDLTGLLESGHIQQLQSEEERMMETAQTMPARAAQLFFDIRRFPHSRLTERYRRLGFNGHRAKLWLLKERLIMQKDVSSGRGTVALLSITESGKRLLDLYGPGRGPPEEEPSFCGGPDHEFVKDDLAIFLGLEGWEKVRKEKDRIDVSAERNGKRVAFEVETGKSDALDNILNDLKKGCRVVVVVGLSREVRERVRKEVDHLIEGGAPLENKVFVVGMWDVKGFVREHLKLLF